MYLYFIVLLFLYECAQTTSFQKPDALIEIVPGTDEKVFGKLALYKERHGIYIEGRVQNLSPGLHGFHIHEKGLLGNQCKDAGEHFNPSQKSHGGATDYHRHVGDLGNIYADQSGTAKISLFDSHISLDPSSKNFIGKRSFVVHGSDDDLGRGGDEQSLKTGNSGSRVGCGIIVVLGHSLKKSPPVYLKDHHSNYRAESPEYLRSDSDSTYGKVKKSKGKEFYIGNNVIKLQEDEILAPSSANLNNFKISEKSHYSPDESSQIYNFGKGDLVPSSTGILKNFKTGNSQRMGYSSVGFHSQHKDSQYPNLLNHGKFSTSSLSSAILPSGSKTTELLSSGSFGPGLLASGSQNSGHLLSGNPNNGLLSPGMSGLFGAGSQTNGLFTTDRQSHGLFPSGSQNHRLFSSGIGNQGLFSSGHKNLGLFSSGSQQQDMFSSGHNNQALFQSGIQNHGLFPSSNQNHGHLSTGSQGHGLFSSGSQPKGHVSSGGFNSGLFSPTNLSPKNSNPFSFPKINSMNLMNMPSNNSPQSKYPSPGHINPPGQFSNRPYFGSNHGTNFNSFGGNMFGSHSSPRVTRIKRNRPSLKKRKNRSRSQKGQKKKKQQKASARHYHVDHHTYPQYPSPGIHNPHPQYHYPKGFYLGDHHGGHHGYGAHQFPVPSVHKTMSHHYDGNFGEHHYGHY